MKAGKVRFDQDAPARRTHSPKFDSQGAISIGAKRNDKISKGDKEGVNYCTGKNQTGCCRLSLYSRN